MSDARWSPAFLMTIAICVLITFLSLEADAQSTVDDSASCESSSLDETVNLIKEEVKNFCRPNQQQNSTSNISRKDFEDLKAACASSQQQCPPPTEPSSSNQISSFICEYRNHIMLSMCRYVTGTCCIRHQSYRDGHCYYILSEDGFIQSWVDFRPQNTNVVGIMKQLTRLLQTGRAMLRVCQWLASIRRAQFYY